MASEIDKIKKKLNIEKMDKNDRTSMFNKFVEKGGEVIKEKYDPPVTRNQKSKNSPNISNSTQKGSITQNKRETYSFDKGEEISFFGKKRTTKQYPFGEFIKGVFQGYWGFGGSFSVKFIKNMRDEFHKTLSYLYLSIDLILGMEPAQKWELYEMINKYDVYGVELMIRIYNLHKTKVIKKISEYFQIRNSIKCEEIVDSIGLIYRELIPIYPYSETIRNVLERASGIYEAITKKTSYMNKQELNNAINMIFGYYFPIFHAIINYNVGRRVPFEYFYMNREANFAANEDIGSITRALAEEKKDYLAQLELEKEETKKKIEEDIEQKDMEKLPKSVQKGLELIDKVVSNIDNFTIEDVRVRNFEKNEKMLEIYALLKEFDEEYLFLQTTSQIKLVSRSDKGKKIDIRGELDELNIKYTEITSLLKDYHSLLDDNSKLDTQYSNTPMILRQKRLQIKDKRYHLFVNIRNKASQYFKSFAIILEKIIRDYQEQKLLLQNPEEKLDIAYGQEKRKFQGVSIIQAIGVTYSFMSALYYYLNSGRLGGTGLYIEEVEEKEFEDEDENSDIDFDIDEDENDE